MATKSVIEIELIDEQFKAFGEQLKKMQDIIGKMPDQWKKITKEVEAEGKAEDKVTNESDKKRKTKLKEEKDFNKVLEDRKKAFRDTASHTKDIATNLASGALSIAKWTAAGLLGGGFGLLGIGTSASADRRTAQQFGINTGQLKAVRNVLGQKIGDTDSILANFAGLLTTAQGKSTLSKVGVKYGESDPVEALITAIPNIQKLVKQFGAFGADFWRTQGLEDVMPYLQAKGISNLTPDEIAEIRPSIAQKTKEFATSDEQNLAWQNFVIKMDEAGKKIEVVFIKNLDKILPVIERLSTGLTNWLDRVTSDEEGMNKFATNLVKVSELMGVLAESIGYLIDKFPSVKTSESWGSKLYDIIHPKPSAQNSPFLQDINNIKNKSGNSFYDLLEKTKKSYKEKFGKDLPINSLERDWDQQKEVWDKTQAGVAGYFAKVNPMKYAKDFMFHKNAADISRLVDPSFMEGMGWERKDPKGDPVHWTPRINSTITINDNTGGNVNTIVNATK